MFSPNSGWISSVGVITPVGVGKVVGVDVGGNQTSVGVGVIVAAAAVFVGNGGGGVLKGEQLHINASKNPKMQKKKMFRIFVSLL